MKNVLIVSGHTDIVGDSAANKEICAQLRQRLPEAAISSLSELYPDFKIDVAAEQAKCEAADVIVLQFPVFWFAMPSLLQKWMEDTFVHGWSHGSSGHALEGKKLVISCTTGAPLELYAKDAPMGYTVEEFFSNSFATAGFTGMELAGVIATGGVSYQMRGTEEGEAAIRAKACEHVERLVSLVESL